MSEIQRLLITCPQCKKALSVKREFAGKRVRCPNEACGSAFEVLDPAKLATPPATIPVPVAIVQVPQVVPSRQPAAPPTPKHERPLDIADQIQKLHQLHVSGALSAEEFAKAKQACLVQMIPIAPARQEEYVKTEAVEEEIVETQAVNKEAKKRTKPPPLPPQPPGAPQRHYRAADFKDLYMKFLMAYLTIMSTQLIVFFPSDSLQKLNYFTMIPRMILFVVLSGIFLYRAWAQIQDGRARTTPGKAVGFRFIPFYNFYWEFVAVKGLGEDIEHYAHTRRIAINPIPRILSLSYCIAMMVLSVVSGIIVMVVTMKVTALAYEVIPLNQHANQIARIQNLNQVAGILGFLLGIPTAVLLLILLKKIADASAAIAEAKHPAVPVAVAVPAHDGTVQTTVGIVAAVSAGLNIVEKVIDKGHH